jgi:DNA-binding HxlR family transcriptional regulator
MPRRSYDQYCAVARALDVLGERWALLIVRELLAGPRRYTDLHADLPGISTDMLATRLRELERDGLLTRRRLPAPAAAVVYELTGRGTALLPVLAGLAGWGGPLVADERPTDAVRPHWAAIPLLDLLPVVPGVLEVQVEVSRFHLRLGDGGRSFADGAADAPDCRLALDPAALWDLVARRVTLPGLLAGGRARLEGDGPLCRALAGDRDIGDGGHVDVVRPPSISSRR